MKCDAALLWTLVEQQADPGHESDRIARHLESCETCRIQLTELGGDDTWWHDARQWLSKSEAEEAAVEPLPAPLPPADLGFLEEPAHPEMLGRIGRYDVEGFLGRGGMGVVLRAYDSDLQRSVAVKVLAPQWAASAPARQRFAREAQAAASVTHENVIPIYNVEADGKLPFLVMRYVPGMTLQHWVKKNGVPDTPTILRVTGQLAEGLAAAHRRGLVHRDVKPGNVLVGENIDRVWITDFGLARAADAMTLTQTGVLVGTPHYMSPEQVRGESVDYRSDLFSLGCVLYFLCTGRPPFDAESPLAVLHQLVSETPQPLTEIRGDLPPSLVKLVERLLSRRRERRPQDCQEVIDTLAGAHSEWKQGRVARRGHRLLTPGKTAFAGLAMLTLVALACWQWMPGTTNAGQGGAEFSSVPAANQPPIKIDPYVIKASRKIGQGALLDQQRFEAEVARIHQQLNQLERLPAPVITPTAKESSSQWDQEIRQLNHVIQRASLP